MKGSAKATSARCSNRSSWIKFAAAWCRGAASPFALCAVFACEVFLSLHLDQTAHGALEFEAEALAVVEIGWRCRCGDDEIDAVIVQLVDQSDEAPGRVFAL